MSLPYNVLWDVVISRSSANLARFKRYLGCVFEPLGAAWLKNNTKRMMWEEMMIELKK